MRELLSINNLSKKYMKKEILTDISLSADCGQCYALVGENGAGKSTFIKCLLGFDKKYEGKIVINTQKIGYVPECIELPFNIELYDYLFIRGKIERYESDYLIQIIKEAIEYWGLNEYQRVKIGNLSKGNRQKVSIIQSYLFEQRLIVLDEPETGLDPNGQEILRKLILKLRSEGRLIIFSSHSLDSVKRIATNVVIFKNHHLIADIDVGNLETEDRTIEQYYFE